MACKGCAGFEIKSNCQLIIGNRDKDCPCKVCLIRSMCIDTCKEYKVYASIILNYKRGI